MKTITLHITTAEAELLCDALNALASGYFPTEDGHIYDTTEVEKLQQKIKDKIELHELAQKNAERTDNNLNRTTRELC